MSSFKLNSVASVSFAVSLALVGSALSGTVQAQPKAQAESEACAKLRNDYEDASKKLALNDARNRHDNSAIRATMRETENSNIISQSRMVFDIMKSNGCKLPDHIPSASFYLVAASFCALSPEDSCDISEWKRNKSE